VDCPKDNTFPFERELQEMFNMALFSALHHLRWGQGQVVKRYNMMEQREKAREKI
jgi:hypothetical protein